MKQFRRPPRPARLQPLIGALTTHGWDLTIRNTLDSTGHQITIHAHHQTRQKAIRAAWATDRTQQYRLTEAGHVNQTGHWITADLDDITTYITGATTQVRTA